MIFPPCNGCIPILSQLNKPAIPSAAAVLNQPKFICHVRLKRSGAWRLKSHGNGMLRLRCSLVNGTFNEAFARYVTRDQAKKISADKRVMHPIMKPSKREIVRKKVLNHSLEIKQLSIIIKNGSEVVSLLRDISFQNKWDDLFKNWALQQNLWVKLGVGRSPSE